MPLGFSVLGIIVHPISSDSGRMTKYDKSFGRDLKTSRAADAPRVFLDVVRSGLNRVLLRLVLDRMCAIRRLYEEQRRYHTYASSLLFAYDALAVRKFLRGEADEAELARWVDVKLIDFAHAFPSADGSRDENFLRGITNLMAVFESLLSEEGRTEAKKNPT